MASNDLVLTPAIQAFRASIPVGDLIPQVADEHSVVRKVKQLCLRLHAFAFLFKNANVGYASCNLSGNQFQKTAIVIVQTLVTVDADGQNSHNAFWSRLRNRKKSEFGRAHSPESAWQRKTQFFQLIELHKSARLYNFVQIRRNAIAIG